MAAECMRAAADKSQRAVVGTIVSEGAVLGEGTDRHRATSERVDEAAGKPLPRGPSPAQHGASPYDSSGTWLLSFEPTHSAPSMARAPATPRRAECRTPSPFDEERNQHAIRDARIPSLLDATAAGGTAVGGGASRTHGAVLGVEMGRGAELGAGRYSPTVDPLAMPHRGSHAAPRSARAGGSGSASKLSSPLGKFNLINDTPVVMDRTEAPSLQRRGSEGGAQLGALNSARSSEMDGRVPVTARLPNKEGGGFSFTTADPDAADRVGAHHGAPGALGVAATATEGAAMAAAVASTGSGAVAGTIACAAACVASASFCAVASRDFASSASAGWWDSQRRGERSSRPGALSSRRCGEGVGSGGGGGACFTPFVAMAAVRGGAVPLAAAGRRLKDTEGWNDLDESDDELHDTRSVFTTHPRSAPGSEVESDLEVDLGEAGEQEWKRPESRPGTESRPTSPTPMDADMVTPQRHGTSPQRDDGGNLPRLSSASSLHDWSASTALHSRPNLVTTTFPNLVPTAFRPISGRNDSVDDLTALARAHLPPAARHGAPSVLAHSSSTAQHGALVGTPRNSSPNMEGTLEGLGSFTRRTPDEPSFHGGCHFAPEPGTTRHFGPEPGTAFSLAQLCGPLPEGGGEGGGGGEGRCHSRAGSTSAAAGWGTGNLLSERSAWLNYADEIDQRWPGLGARDGASSCEEADSNACAQPTRRDAGGGGAGTPAGIPAGAQRDADTWRSLARSLAARSTRRSMDGTLNGTLVTTEDISESDEPEYDEPEYDAQSVTFAEYGAQSGAPSRAPSDLSDGGDDSPSHQSTRRHLSTSYMAAVPPGRREALWSYPRFSSDEE